MNELTPKEVAAYWANQWRIADEEAAVYRAALRQIANGKGDPQKIAWDVLRDYDGSGDVQSDS